MKIVLILLYLNVHHALLVFSLVYSDIKPDFHVTTSTFFTSSSIDKRDQFTQEFSFDLSHEASFSPIIHEVQLIIYGIRTIIQSDFLRSFITPRAPPRN